uniref:Uncharacterized protein n=1 Tax=Paenarthrobacter aurescens TaxID=43663 RepID=Q6SK92_PAEAU|nr:hypothetical protein [Paenarthrobacter aurescens]
MKHLSLPLQFESITAMNGTRNNLLDEMGPGRIRVVGADERVGITRAADLPAF